MKGRDESESEQEGGSVCAIDFSLPNCVKTFENNNNKKNDNKPLLPQLWARLWIIHRIRVGHVMAVYKFVSVE